MKPFRAVVLIIGIYAVAIVYAQQPATPAGQAGARGAGGGQRGTPPPPDPRDMGGGRCAANPYNCADAKNPLPAVSTVWLVGPSMMIWLPE